MKRRFLLSLPLAWIPTWRASAAFKNANYTVRRRGPGGKSERAAETLAKDSLEFQVTADEPFPVRALDPVLKVGTYKMSDYRYGNPENTLLIFTCGDPGELADNSPVIFEYENDERTRTEMRRFRRSEIQ